MTFWTGVNLPWIDYGLDFGANAWQPQGGVASRGRRARLQAVCEDLEERGCQVVRWFLIGDGRAGVRFAADGTPLGLDDRFLADADHAIATAGRHRLRLLFVLVDFLWLRRARAVKRASGWAAMRGRCPIRPCARGSWRTSARRSSRATARSPWSGAGTSSTSPNGRCAGWARTRHRPSAGAT